MTKREINKIVADRRYWEKLAYMVGWRLLGWTDRKHATYATSISDSNSTLAINGQQRDDIVHTYEKVAEIKLPKCLTCGDRLTILRQYSSSDSNTGGYRDIPCPACQPVNRSAKLERRKR